MRPTALLLLCLLAGGACREYNLERHVTTQSGLVSADRYALYGREQAISVAIGREFARPYNSGPEAQTEVAITYAQKKFASDIVNITPDPLGHRLTVTFKSGWRVAILPIADGKTGDETRIPS